MPDMYMETTTNQTYLAQRKEATSHAADANKTTTGGSDGSSGSGSGSQSGVSNSGAARLYAGLPVLAAAMVAGLALFI